VFARYGFINNFIGQTMIFHTENKYRIYG